MGYILPINHYQYQDYHHRTIQKERSPFAMEKVIKASLEHKFRYDYDQPNPQVRRNVYQKPPKQSLYAPESTRFSPGAHEKIYSKMTGKGRYFSENV
ncbi:hypothetical protein EQV77_10730 [Halobacillus fulvus]|nr:hypothetical protein EQV77_10730 [Halobacillus fulvus]